MIKQALCFLACACLILTVYAVGWPQKPEMIVQTGHSSAVVSVAFSPDGKLLASGGADNIVKLWEVATRRVLRTFTGQPKPIDSVAFSPDGKLLASASGLDKTVKLWDVVTATGRELHTFAGHSDHIRALLL